MPSPSTGIGTPRTHRSEELSRRRVSRLLDCDHLSRLDQDPADQVERLLGAVGDDDLVGRSPERAGHGRMPGHRGAQPRLARRVAISPGMGLQREPGIEPAPDIAREQRPVGDTRPEVEPVCGDIGSALVHRDPAIAVRGCSAAPLGCASRLDPPYRLGSDEGARPDPPLEKPLSGEPLVGDRHGVTGHRQLLGQQPARGQPVADRRRRFDDRLDDLAVDPLRQVAPSGQADVELHRSASQLVW